MGTGRRENLQVSTRELLGVIHILIMVMISCIPMFKIIKLYALNMYSLLYVCYFKIKKDVNNVWRTLIEKRRTTVTIGI